MTAHKPPIPPEQKDSSCTSGKAGKTPLDGSPTNTRDSRVSGGGGEWDSHHTHTKKRS